MTLTNYGEGTLDSVWQLIELMFKSAEIGDSFVGLLRWIGQVL